MTERKYNKLIKSLEKNYELLRTLDSDSIYKRQAFSNVKVKLHRVIKELKDNEYYWVKYKE